MKKILFFIFAFNFLTLNAIAATDLDAAIAAARAESIKLDKQIRASDRDVSKTQKELVRAAAKLSDIESENDKLTARLSELESRDAELRQSIKSTESRLAEASAALLQIATSPAGNLAPDESIASSILLSGIADSFDAALAAAERDIRELAETRRDMTHQQEKVAQSMAKLSKQKSSLDALLADRGKQNAKIKASRAEIDARLADLAARAKNIADLSDQVAAAAPSKSSSAGKMQTPARGTLLLAFGEKSNLGLTSDGWHIRTRANETIVAPDDAFVEFADNFRGRNKVLILNHRNGYYSVLAQLSELSVVAGQMVLSGEPVGRMGGGRPELYLELRRAKSAVDPAKLFSKPKGR